MTMEVGSSPVGDDEDVRFSEHEGSVVDLVAVEQLDERDVKRGIDFREISVVAFLIEVAAVMAALALFRPPTSVTAVLAPVTVLMMGSVRFRRERLQEHVAERTVAAAVRAGAVGAALAPVAIVNDALGTLAAVLTLTIVVSGTMTLAISKLARRRPRRTLIVGAGPVTVDLADHIVEKSSAHLDLIGVLETDHTPEHRHPVVGRPEDLITIARATAAEVVIVSYGPFAPEDFVADLRECAAAVDVYVVPRFFELGRDSDRQREEINGYPLLKLSPAAATRPSWRLKRLIDLVASTLLLILLSPVMAVVAIGVRLSSEGPIVFRQKRVGHNQAVFEILKFRTMTQNDDADITWTVENDPRVTRFGEFLRASHLDELPQLINVLRGEMSLVGPRPERPYFVDRFCQEHDRYGDRHRVPPGISGWSQVNGLWGDTSVEARARLDNRYIEDWSIAKDIKIMLQTIPTLANGRE